MLVASIPAKFSIPWANSAGGSYINAIPTASQIGITAGAASLTDGFPPTTMQTGGTPPAGPDFNGILKWVTQWAQWQAAGGPVAYDATFQTAIGGYPKGSTVSSATTFGIAWLSTVDSNTTNPDTGGAGWTKAVGWGPYYAQDTGSANALVVSDPAISSAFVGMTLLIKKSAAANTGPINININGWGGANCNWADGSALANGDWPANATAIIEYDGVNMNLLSVMGPTVFVKNVPAANRVFSTSSSTPGSVSNATLSSYALTAGSASFGSQSGALFTFSQAGVYAITSQMLMTVNFTGASNVSFVSQIDKNGVAVASNQVGNWGSSPESASIGVSTTITAAIGDTISLYGSVSNGSFTSGSIDSASLSIVKII